MTVRVLMPYFVTMLELYLPSCPESRVVAAGDCWLRKYDRCIGSDQSGGTRPLNA